ncbi:MAG: hypothetical protein ACMUHB_04455, partial [Thermoplasmatota archaeon]
NIAFILELVGGILGFLGIGHMYAGEINNGVLRLIVWMLVLWFSWIIVSLLSVCLIGFFFIPVVLVAQIGIPLWSAFDLKRRLDEAFPE